jgi:hypothetical protein
VTDLHVQVVREEDRPLRTIACTACTISRRLRPEPGDARVAAELLHAPCSKLWPLKFNFFTWLARQPVAGGAKEFGFEAPGRARMVQEVKAAFLSAEEAEAGPAREDLEVFFFHEERAQRLEQGLRLPTANWQFELHLIHALSRFGCARLAPQTSCFNIFLPLFQQAHLLGGELQPYTWSEVLEDGSEFVYSQDVFSLAIMFIILTQTGQELGVRREAGVTYAEDCDQPIFHDSPAPSPAQPVSRRIAAALHPFARPNSPLLDLVDEHSNITRERTQSRRQEADGGATSVPETKAGQEADGGVADRPSVAYFYVSLARAVRASVEAAEAEACGSDGAAMAVATLTEVRRRLTCRSREDCTLMLALYMFHLVRTRDGPSSSSQERDCARVLADLDAEQLFVLLDQGVGDYLKNKTFNCFNYVPNLLKIITF